jgi:hypothetical protein
MSEPTRITEKYLAGFVDADGTFGIRFKRMSHGWKALMYLEAGQTVKKDKIIHRIRETFGGYIQVMPRSGYNGDEYSKWNLTSKQSETLLSRIRKHLVLKRAYADFCLSYMQIHRGFLNDEQMQKDKQLLQEARSMRSDPLPNYPSRKWVAGYFDGDGCIASRLNNSGRFCKPAVLQARIETDRTEGIELLQKAFGGKIYNGRVQATKVWILHLEPSKAKKFLGYFCKHSITKRAEIYFALGCAEGGNYRDGIPIRQALQHLKTQEQRLNDPEVNVSFLLHQVRFDIPSMKGRYERLSNSPAQIKTA